MLKKEKKNWVNMNMKRKMSLEKVRNSFIEKKMKNIFFKWNIIFFRLYNLRKNKIKISKINELDINYNILKKWRFSNILFEKVYINLYIKLICSLIIKVLMNLLLKSMFYIKFTKIFLGLCIFSNKTLIKKKIMFQEHYYCLDVGLFLKYV